MPRAALLSIHARVEGTEPTTLDDPSLVQVWGPRCSAYVVAASDLAVFTLGRMPPDATYQAFAQGLADELEAFLDGRRLGYGDAGDGMGIVPNRLRYAAVTGRIVMRWDGARQPTIWMVPAPDSDPAEARLELARRYLHVYRAYDVGGVRAVGGDRGGRASADSRRSGTSSCRSRTPIGDAWILASDEPAFMAPAAAVDRRASPAERGHLVPPPGSRPRTAGTRSGPRWRAVDDAGVAGCGARRGRGRRDVAARPGHALDQHVAGPHAVGAVGGRGRGGIAATARDRARHRRPLES